MRLMTRAAVNVANLSTPLGLLIAALGGARVRRGPDGLVLAHGYRLRVPPAAAFTVGNVVLLRRGALPAGGPALLGHESRHATQYAWCAGPLLWVAYGVASAWSWLRTGDPASRNVFERHAGLVQGGYRERAARPLPRLARRR